jgi:hypothetical protein
MKKESKRAKKTVGSPQPDVGIFWLVNGRLLFDSTPLSEAEPDAGYLGHAPSHIDVWAQFQRFGKSPRESEYEEFPRGRVMYHPAAEEFTILADKCILDRKDLIIQIKMTLHLPPNTTLATDSHYRCFTCLYGNDDLDHESGRE